MKQILLGMTAWKDLVDIQVKNTLAAMKFWKSFLEYSQKR